ncbi:MAG: hypothetical protein QG662_381 [Pseudomonadota bacterium]|nr:hypothetical protein [Pseudomonadota bacterium]
MDDAQYDLLVGAIYRAARRWNPDTKAVLKGPPGMIR